MHEACLLDSSTAESVHDGLDHGLHVLGFHQVKQRRAQHLLRSAGYSSQQGKKASWGGNKKHASRKRDAW